MSLVTPKQKFHRGDRVRIAAKMPFFMSHFRHDVDAIVVGSYVDMCYQHVGGNEDGSSYKKYELMILDDHPSTCAWYYEDQLTPISGPCGLTYLNLFLRVPFG